MSEPVKSSLPWEQANQDDQSTDSGAENNSDLIEVNCPDCGQALALGREYLGGHCLCSTCDGLMRVNDEETGGGERRIVVEIVEKETGKKVGNTAPTYAPNKGGAVIGEGTKPVKPWPKEFKGLAGRRAAGKRPELKNKAGENDGENSNLLQVPCPACGQVLALGREVLGSHCLCSVCEELMLISLQSTDGGGMSVVAEKVDKVTGEKVADTPATSAPEQSEPSDEEDWENTRPVKMWSGASSETGDDEVDMGLTMPVPKMDGEAEDEMDMGLTMPVPKMDGEAEDEMDMGLTMPVPKMDGEAEEEMDIGLTMPVPKMDGEEMDIGATMPVPKMDSEEAEKPGLGSTMPTPSESSGKQIDWNNPTPSQPQAPVAANTPTGGGQQPWNKVSTGSQGVKLAPPGSQTENVKGNNPSPTSGAVPTATTPPTKAPPPTTGSVPTLDTGQVAARKEAAWVPPGVKAGPTGKETKPQPAQTKKEAKKQKTAEEKKKSDPFGNKSSQAAPKKKAPKQRRRTGKSHKGLMFILLMIPVTLGALALFIMAPGLIPGGKKAREFVDGKIDEGMGRVEELLAERAMNAADAGPADAGAAVVGEAPDGAADGGANPEGGANNTNTVASQTYEQDAALRKVLSQEGEQVIRRFYGASTVEEKLAFVVDGEEARADMERYFADVEIIPTVRSVMFRGGARDIETGYYYGVFDVTENENDIPRRWCVVDAGTGLYQVDWLFYRQIVASELGAFLVTPAESGVKKSFKMLLKLGSKVSSEDNPWFEDAVSVELQVPMISSNWFPVLMKKPLAESLGVTTKLADDRLVIGVVEIEWVPGEKSAGKSQPVIVGIKRWGAWAQKEF